MNRCFNPECNRELRYLSEGSVYQWETGTGGEFHSEFFWLCPVCSATFELAAGENGKPLLAPCGSRGECKQRGSRIRRVLKGVARSHGEAELQTLAGGRRAS